ncbi:MAG: hypothetical protein HOE30_08325 [Deltaproteobacteria bacterium]|jgi:hypothetical protein|nr:hypothetical protein [Deltaproteobacteria bacterium]MBT4268252.1 hypothetical protein [Deltaproteobacteria bacterium]MBT4639095.1 hypothetical protein [Deltaproteobacteria bacterium]MBT6501169.1 hypothetical protein [Deltaproteobacteria bacterium]MBT6616207.1 hypothetical protein [Deltaproteobacteria bacterium]
MILRHLFFVLLLLIFVNSALAEKILQKKSQTGGDIIETVFEDGDNEFQYLKKVSHYDPAGHKIKDESFILRNDYNKLGLEKTVKTYNRQGRLIQVEIVFRKEKALTVGYDRLVLFYDQQGNHKRTDVHFRDAFLDEQIYSLSRSFYDLSGVKTRTVYFFTGRLTKITGYHRIIEQYDRHGNKISEQILDKDGNIH